jgi:hypothetical protein
MHERTIETTVTFKREFMLTAFDRPQPAGTYRLVTDEEQILGLSFFAFRRTATALHLPAIATSEHPREAVLVDPKELDAALLADARA